MSDTKDNMFEKQLTDCKHLIASSVVVGNILYGVRGFQKLPPLPSSPTQIERRQRIIAVAQRSFGGGVRFGGLIGTCLLCDYGLQRLRNVDQNDKVNKALAGAFTGGLFSLFLGGGPAVAVSGSLSLASLGLLYQMTMDTFKYIDDQVSSREENVVAEKEDSYPKD